MSVESIEYEIFRERVCPLCNESKKNYEFFLKGSYCKECTKEKTKKFKQQFKYPNFDQKSFLKKWKR